MAFVRTLVFVAPTEEDLKHEYIALRLTTTEAQSFAALIAQRLDSGGLWTKSVTRGGYPVLCRQTQHSRAERFSPLHRRTHHCCTYLCSHVVLVAAGFKPLNTGLQASHLCHTPRCCLVDHLVWEYGSVNLKRRYCTDKPACVCGSYPPCIPTAHREAQKQ